MKKLTGLLALLVFGIASAQQDPEAQAVLDAMSNKYKSMNAFTVEFKQTLKNESAGLNESVEGVVTVKDVKYRLQISGQEIYNDGENIWTYNEDIQEVTVAEYIPEDMEISLNNIWDVYKQGFKYILLSSDANGNKTVDLDPVDRSKSFFKIRMIIGNDSALKSFTVFENSGNQYVYDIVNLTETRNIPEGYFVFDTSAHPDVEVIDFR